MPASPCPRPGSRNRLTPCTSAASSAAASPHRSPKRLFCVGSSECRNPTPASPTAITTTRRASLRRQLYACTDTRSEEHTSELQSQSNLVCRLLLEKKTSSLLKTKTFLSCIAPILSSNSVTPCASLSTLHEGACLTVSLSSPSYVSVSPAFIPVTIS